MEPVLVSACLLGLATRYDGRDCRREALIQTLEGERLLPVPICPEQLGGLPTPRPASEIAGGAGPDVLAGSARVVAEGGGDVTEAFRRGAQAALAVARATGAPACVPQGPQPLVRRHGRQAGRADGPGLRRHGRPAPASRTGTQ